MSPWPPVPTDFVDPDWENTQMCHDWKNHVPEDVRVIWNGFTESQKMALSLWARNLADQEEWE